ncbi:MAG: response regulator, partial [Pseudomonadota bacterium]
MSGRILIADEIPTNRIILRVKLASARYDVLQVGLAMDLIPTAREQRPDVILLDDAMGDGAGIKLCRALKADKIAGSIP